MRKNQSIHSNLFGHLATTSPTAIAKINGGSQYPDIHGIVEFYQFQKGVLVVADIENLPTTSTNIFAFHIHNGTTCDDDFANSGTHYNPTNVAHPNHAGDMSPLFASSGEAFLAFFDNRFALDDVIGKVVIIHDQPDDFTTQPAGNSGTKIACGVIEKVN